ncbi:TPA: GTP 3',8-cyclase MoaA [Candidatus Bathyarchaeota archaeon]|nr:GTP 3',8-cyclase MoaA [Candidatus Bathyarchaeota archaeon]
MLKDPYGRPLESIRISVTQRCNLNCFYCHREGEVLSRKDEMTPEEIQKIIAIAASFGLGKVKLTGGEPLLRGDILDIVARIHETPGIKEVSMTTNGILLSKYAYSLKKAGLARVNVSLDTLMAERFKEITGVDALRSVVSGIAEARDAGLSPVKENMVLLKGLNEHEVSEMIDFARKNDLILQIIELEVPDENEWYKRYHASLDAVEHLLENMAESITVRKMHHRKKYHLRGGGEVEVVKPMHNTEFCCHCNRIRVTSDGKLKPCLFRNDNLVDMLGPIRRGASEDLLRKLFLETVKRREPYFK